MTGSIRTVVVLVLLSAPGLAGQGSEIPGYPQSADVANPGRSGAGSVSTSDGGPVQGPA